jgi:hypothetical protein
LLFAPSSTVRSLRRVSLLASTSPGRSTLSRPVHGLHWSQSLLPFWRYTDTASPLPLRLYGKLSESSLKALYNGISFVVSSTLAVALPLSSSRLQHLVALLSPFQALDALLVHLLFHLGESLSFFFRGALGLDSLDSSLLNSQLSSVLSQSHGFLPVAQTPSLPSAPSPSP